MKNIFKSFLVAAALFSVSACKLDLYPNTNITYVPGEHLIQTEEDVEMYGAANYAYFRSTVGVGGVADDLMCDGFNASLNYGNNYGGVHRADMTFTSGDEYVQSFWSNAYSAIRVYNICIEEASKVNDETLAEECKEIIAEAKFFRAYAYLRLARRFAPAYSNENRDALCVPLVLVYNQNERPARATVAQVYEQIGKDLDDAFEYFEGAAGQAGSKYVTEDAINALYANYYLDIQDYDNAYKKANGIIETKTYELCSTSANLLIEFTNDGLKVETLTGGQTKTTETKEAIMRLASNFSAGEGPSVSFNLYSSYGKDPNSPVGESFKALYLPSQYLIDQYEVTDIRRSCWFDNCANVPFSCNGSYSSKQFYVFTKLIGNVELSSNEYPDGSLAPVPFSLPEMHLIAAEAAFKGNKKLQALAALKALQEARKATPTSTITLEAIQKEWFRETVGQGCRMECLKRWGLGCEVRYAQAGAIAENVIMKGASFDERALAANDFHFCWPIPSYEIKVNPNLKQNPGYSSAE